MIIQPRNDFCWFDRWFISPLRSFINCWDFNTFLLFYCRFCSKTPVFLSLALCRKKDAETAELMHLLRRLKINNDLYSRKKVRITVTATCLVKNSLQHSVVVYVWARNRDYTDVECIGLINSAMLPFGVADQLPHVWCLWSLTKITLLSISILHV